MYDDERKILTDRLDKPVIHNRKKIRDKYRQDIQTMGQKQHISTAEDMKLREMLLSPQNKVEDTRNEKNGCALLLFLEIFFTIAVLIASLAVTVMPQEPSGRTMADAISTFFFIEIPLWLPFLIIMNNHGKIKKAVEKGNFEKYNFQIREKVYQLFSGEDYVVTNHYIEIAGMYMYRSVKTSLRGLNVGRQSLLCWANIRERIIFHILMKMCFTMILKIVFGGMIYHEKRHTNSTNKWRNSYEGSNRDIEGIFEAAWKWRTAGSSKKRFRGSI